MFLYAGDRRLFASDFGDRRGVIVTIVGQEIVRHPNHFQWCYASFLPGLCCSIKGPGLLAELMGS